VQERLAVAQRAKERGRFFYMRKKCQSTKR
jgi:hypothetical protein